ncbi:uncharacterized protein LOC117203739 isoform X2 [Orcinus orca]|uniref:uncharacterized protein LOC117203739 isoform X2 n=1 Tax=Orcinus orca TaxID=9733 RepID=UPI00211145B8|nr:uncharacterized protein LOC117203739 isoform X2 [Orcinus orca]
MEVLDEFDSEFPQSVTFCQLIPEEDFERQAATYTESALRLLFLSLDRNLALDERVVRKGKQAECERRGLLSFLWVRAREGGAPGFRGGGGAPVSALLELLVGDFKEAAPARRLTRPASSSLPLPLSSQAKVSCAVQGELNCCNSMGALEMHQRLEQLKRRIHRVHLYSQDAKKRSKRKLKKPEPILLWDQSTSPCLPPTLLPLPATTMASMVAPSTSVYTLPRVFGPFPPLPSTSME